MLDFENIMKDRGYWKDDNWNMTKHTYSFETGTKIEFFSPDTYGKAHGPRRDVLFANEANNLEYRIIDQLITRTREIVWLDWNPSVEFWFYTEILPYRDAADFDFITLTYLDNEALDEITIKEIESHRRNKSWWKVYGEGQLGEVEGKIYKGWQIIDEVPFEARLKRRSLDFGYSNDPSAIVDIYEYNGGLILDEQCFQKGLSNKQIADIILNCPEPQMLVIADCAEPKSIDELRSYGLTVLPSDKGKDSVVNGIQLVQDQRISVTSRSTNVIKEYRNYLWMTDRDGKIINMPEHQFSHCFAPETLVYTTKGKKRIDELVGQEGYLYSRDGRVERFYDVKPTRTNADVLSLEFDDGKILTVTPDHQLLSPNGEWIEAGLLSVGSMIQSGTYRNKSNIRLQADVLWQNLYKIYQRVLSQGLYQRGTEVYTPSLVGVSQRENTQWFSYSSQKPQQGRQSFGKFGTFKQGRPFATPLSGMVKESRTDRKEKETLRQNKTSYQEMARLKRGEGMAQSTRNRSIQNKDTYKEKLCSLPQRIYNYGLFLIRKILPPELQNESQTKTITGITRGFRPITYNLEVENTHCLLVNGVIAHNSMDAIRYGITSLHKYSPDTKAQQHVPSSLVRRR
jgi:phage terminase large subunit